MDSGSRRLPFCLPSTRSSYTSSTRLSSSSLGSSRLHSWEVSANNDRFPRASSAYKAELDQQSSPLGASRDLSSSDSHSASWKLPSSLTSSSRSYDRSWAESSLTSRTKLTDSEGTLGMRSVLLNATDDGDSKRAKLSFSNRGLHSRTPSSLGSTFSSNGLSSGRDAADKQNDASSWTSCRLFSRSSSSSSSKPLLSRRELETKNESSLSGLGERRIKTGLTSSLYQTDRVTSTYALGARPKEATYCSPSPSSYSSTVRESSRNHHTSPSTSRCSSLGRDFSNRTPARFSNASSSLRSSQEQPRSYQSSSDISSSYQSRTTWYTTPPTKAQVALPPRPGPEGGESEGHRSTRRLLSRLFSRRSSQDSSSGSSVRSLDDDGPSIGAPTVVSNQGSRKVESNTQSSEAAFGVLRNRRADLAPIQENKPEVYHRGPAQSRMPLCRERSVGSNNTGNGGSTSSWIPSSLHGHRSPLLSRLRRHTRNEGDHSSAASEEGRTCPQRLLRRWDNLEHNVSQGDDDDEDERNEAGAIGLGAFGESHPSKPEDEKLPELNEGAIEFSPRPGRGPCDNISLPASSFSGVEHLMGDQREKPISSTDHDKLRKIKERLLLEDSDEEEGDLCRICQMGEESASNPLIQPCHCIGSLQYVHQECIKRWLCSKISSATNLEAISTCELCKEKLRLNIDNFDIQELYRTHVQSEYDEFISSGLYLVVLLHFCEQRFSDVLGAVDAAGLFNLLRILHEHMDNLQNQHSEDEEEARDSRPSVEFSDLDDDFEEEY